MSCQGGSDGNNDCASVRQEEGKEKIRRRLPEKGGNITGYLKTQMPDNLFSNSSSRV